MLMRTRTLLQGRGLAALLHVLRRVSEIPHVRICARTLTGCSNLFVVSGCLGALADTWRAAAFGQLRPPHRRYRASRAAPCLRCGLRGCAIRETLWNAIGNVYLLYVHTHKGCHILPWRPFLCCSSAVGSSHLHSDYTSYFFDRYRYTSSLQSLVTVYCLDGLTANNPFIYIKAQP